VKLALCVRKFSGEFEKAIVTSSTLQIMHCAEIEVGIVLASRNQVLAPNVLQIPH
jgi:hypothetical protein